MSTEDRDSQTLEELLAIMHEHDLDRLKVTSGDAVFELVRREPGAPMFAAPAGYVPAAAAGAAPAGSAATAPANVKRVLAPLTGVFYRAPSPDAEVFVNEGDRIAEGDVVCVLEAMKLFNEIQSEYSGTVVRVLPQNGELVSQGEELFWIAP
ncbi:MAG TPA: biotin/lipoyl-containing protein [Candidatus Baltobacteraceae bacterium]|nr:biotin/lipoyl-containing protein [Candidatus Baltobacteraceae bacterium]